MAFLSWVLHSAYQFVLGQPGPEKKNEEATSVDAEKIKVVKEKKKTTQKEKYQAGTGGFFQMPVHYPRYSKAEYEEMEEWKLDLLLKEYGLSSFHGSFTQKRAFAMGTFLWPHQY